MLIALGQSGHIDPAVIDCVLPAAGRNYSADQSGRPFTGQVRRLHHDPRHFQVFAVVEKQSPAALGTLLIQFDRLGPLTRLNSDTARPTSGRLFAVSA